MKEFINTLLDTSRERIKNPFIGSFLFSFFAFNWKPIILILFEEAPIQQRISIVEENYTSMFNTIALPFAFSIFYVIILPYLMFFFDKLSNYAIIGRKVNQLKLLQSEMRHKVELARSEREYESIRAENKDISELNDRIASLSEELKEERERVNNLKLGNGNFDNNSNLESSFIEDPDLDAEYESLKNREVFDQFEFILGQIKKRGYPPTTANERAIDIFEAMDLIYRVIDEDNQKDYWRLTRKGEYFWRRFVLSTN